MSDSGKKTMGDMFKFSTPSIAKLRCPTCGAVHDQVYSICLSKSCFGTLTEGSIEKSNFMKGYGLGNKRHYVHYERVVERCKVCNEVKRIEISAIGSCENPIRTFKELESDSLDEYQKAYGGK